MFEELKSDKFWKKAAEDPSYQVLRDDIWKLYEEFEGEEIPADKYSDYKIFFNSGSRMEYEHTYFKKRRRVAVCAILCKLYPEKQEYIEELQNVIWAICDEYCWALPAHMGQNDKNDNTFIDLFAAETGYALSEIKYALSDRLEPVVRARIETEIKRRIIDSFLTRSFWWEQVESNWAAVCAGSVGSTFLYEGPELFPLVKPRLDAALNCFLKSFRDDGVCREGLGYWEYGFGFFVCYSDLLKRFSNGKYDNFQGEKIKNIATLLPKMFLQGNCTASFADGSRTSGYNVGISHYLKGLFPEVPTLPDFQYHTLMDRCGRWCYFVRSFVFFRPEYVNEAPVKVGESYYFQDSAWFLKKNQSYGFAVKAGDNGEPHNHNDVGSFILAAGGTQVLADLGAGLYTRQYFENEFRYTILCNSSLGHSVPIINGMEQKPGAEYAGTMSVSENSVTVEFSGAYGIKELKKAERKFVLEESSVLLADEFTFEGEELPVIERFIALTEPVVGNGILSLGKVSFQFDPEEADVSVSEDINDEHNGELLTIYKIDFTLKKGKKRFQTEIVIH